MPSIEKQVTKPISNEHDSSSIIARVREVNTIDQAITCDLYDASGAGIARKRVYPMADIPFRFSAGEAAYCEGQVPTVEWFMATTRIWLDDRGVEYKANDTEAELLVLVDGYVELFGEKYIPPTGE